MLLLLEQMPTSKGHFSLTLSSRDLTSKDDLSHTCGLTLSSYTPSFDRFHTLSHQRYTPIAQDVDTLR